MTRQKHRRQAKGARPASADHERPALTVDAVVLAMTHNDLKVLLITRKNPPFRNHWAIPGGFVDMWEPLEKAAARELAEETGVKLRARTLDPFFVAGDPRRDPRTRVISVVYLAIVRPDEVHPRAADDAKEVGWHSLFNLPPLAFDHRMILYRTVEYLRRRIEYYPFVFPFLPPQFTIGTVRHAFEIIIGQRLEPRRFARTLHGLGMLKPCVRTADACRAQHHRLYRLNLAQLKPAQLARLRIFPALLIKKPG
jgi:8-oxo-dGTP diphosphatase